MLAIILSATTLVLARLTRAERVELPSDAGGQRSTEPRTGRQVAVFARQRGVDEV